MVLEGPDKRLAVLWSTVWDSERDAVEFERALTDQQQRCPLPQKDATQTGNLGDGFRARRQGARVAVVRGLGEATADQLLPALLALPKAAPPRSPPPGPRK